MKGDSLEGIRKAITELRHVEQLMMSEATGSGVDNIPTNKVLQENHDDSKNWQVTKGTPVLLVSFAFEDPDAPSTYPHIETLTPGDRGLADFFGAVQSYVAKQENDGKRLTYVDMRFAPGDFTLAVVDKEYPLLQEDDNQDVTDDLPWNDDKE